MQEDGTSTMLKLDVDVFSCIFRDFKGEILEWLFSSKGPQFSKPTAQDAPNLNIRTSQFEDVTYSNSSIVMGAIAVWHSAIEKSTALNFYNSD